MSELKVLRLPVGQLQSNCYLIFDKKTGDCIVIDPGDDADYIIQKLLERELTPLSLLATHGHFDHINAGLELELAFNIHLYLPDEDLFFLKNNRTTTTHFTKIDPGPPPQVKTHGNNLNFIANSINLEIIKTPGHTPGSVSYYNKDHEIVFVGDLLFANGESGEWRHKYGDKKKLQNSIKKILLLPESTTVYPGHGEESSVKLLKEKFSWALNEI